MSYVMCKNKTVIVNNIFLFGNRNEDCRELSGEEQEKKMQLPFSCFFYTVYLFFTTYYSLIVLCKIIHTL